MSAAAGAPPPPPPSGGNGPSKTPTDNSDPEPWPTGKAQNDHNNWRKNDKIKTCKCKLCGERVKKWSFKCTECAHHICSECADEENGSSGQRYKLVAYHSLRDKCGCFWNSGQAPYIHKMLEDRGVLGPPPKRQEELRRGVEIKQEQARKKKEREAQAQAEAKTPSKSKAGTERSQKPPRIAAQSSPTAGPSDGLSAGNADGNFHTSVKVETTATFGREKRKHNDHPVYTDPETPPDSDPDSGMPPSKHRKASHARSSASYSPPPQPTPAIADQTLEEPALLDPFGTNMPPAQETGRSYEHLENGGTVIVGAGIVGLCIARELAMKVVQTGIKHDITVVEIRDSHSELASGNCAGILSIGGGDESYHNLCRVSHECFNELLSTPGFTEATDLRLDSIYTVARLDGKGRKRKPDWYAGDGMDSFIADKLAMGKLNTQKFATWLYEQCLEYGVDFIFGHDVSEVTGSDAQDIAHVVIHEHHDLEKKQLSLRCLNVVFAAGPWSTAIIKRMYKRSPLQLQNNVQAAHWHRVQVSSMSEKDNAGLLFPEMAVNDEALNDKVAIVGRASDRTLTISSVGNVSDDASLNATDALTTPKSDASLLRHLKKFTAKRLNQGDHDLFAAENGATSGLSFIGTSDERLPVVDKVPASRLGRVCKGDEDRRPCGVWLCFGFGMYGTTLAPGAARAICRRIFGENSGVDDRNFGIPKKGQPKTVHADANQGL